MAGSATKNSNLSNPLSKIVSGESPPVKSGSTGATVQSIKTALNNLGYMTNQSYQTSGGGSSPGAWGIANATKPNQANNAQTQTPTFTMSPVYKMPDGSYAVSKSLITGDNSDKQTAVYFTKDEFAKLSTITNWDWGSGTTGSIEAFQTTAQKVLKEKETLANAAVSSVIDAATVAAIKQFQQANNLPADGIVGKQTAEKLIKVLEDKNNQKTTVSAEVKTNQVTTLSDEKPTVGKDELRIGIQSVPTVVTLTSTDTTTTSSDKKTENSSGVTTTTSKTTTKKITQIDTSTSNIWYPPIEGDVTWDTERSGSPGKVTFKVRADIPISEGDAVSLQYGDKDVFLGFIFERSMSKDGLISVTAYDQTKYFNNPDTYVFSKVKASDVVKKIAKDYGFETGTIEDTAIVIPSIVEDNQTLFDIVYNALDKTVAAGDQVFVFYDDYGKLTLKSLESMRVNLLLCEDTVGDYDYKSSIEDNVYNQIVLYHDDSETNKRQYFTASDQSNIAKWGLLRKTEKVETTNGAQNLANIYLSLYNKKVRKLSIKDAFARPDVRAGTLVPVIMKVGDVSLKNFMLVEKATHTWSNGKYLMSLDLAGAGDFSV